MDAFGLVRLLFGLAVAVVWSVALWRVVVWPAECGPLEASVVAGGWGVSVLPVHCASRPPRAARGRTSGPAGHGPPGGEG
ncbi:hypothetical protein [Streptomyces sp. NPDC005438]|uniref:hypothetical protein n=1 Tax=Streptomyces sp. NPDC005438 TaxID=3156880 RepID=UPI0033A39D84